MIELPSCFLLDEILMHNCRISYIFLLVLLQSVMSLGVKVSSFPFLLLSLFSLHLYQVMIKELKTLYNESRSNSCIEHAKGIMEEEKAPENLSKKISNISLNGTDKKV